MSKEKPSIPKGTRDFSPEVTVKRQYIFNTIKTVFSKYGFMPLETPSMENLSVLTGKYGDEGDQLIFKILDSGDFMSGVSQSDLADGYKPLTRKIASKALRYDLTVPFARFVAMNRNNISLPFKRYQMQPVWRADRPQKGRYREFYQCDADVVGTNSLFCEAEIINMAHEVLICLGLGDYSFKINNRKILAGIAETIGAAGKESELCVAIDKLDKTSVESVFAELVGKGFTTDQVDGLLPIMNLSGSNESRVAVLRSFIGESSETGKTGLDELERVLKIVSGNNSVSEHVQFDPVLARGLSYYTGAIFEVKLGNVAIGSVSGGGRYDNLTGMFGWPNLSGVGFSFGVDRLYDAMEELGLFPENTGQSPIALVANFGADTEEIAWGLAQTLRNNNIRTEFYPDSDKLKKQFGYADSRNIPFVIIAGPDELVNGSVQVRNMKTGNQQTIEIASLAAWFTNSNIDLA